MTSGIPSRSCRRTTSCSTRTFSPPTRISLDSPTERPHCKYVRAPLLVLAQPQVWKAVEVERPPNNKWRTKRKSSPLMYELFDLYLDAKDRECPWLRRRDTAKSLPSTHGYLWQLIFGSYARR
ncbi:hypothetical protein H310_11621 [Aphanomyces invadans]|uniref:Uncharacterized protein n=1 Tax=Aphanomyces invadans TaxID=157072 RepID=A0A024TMZ0_9STRA|nr:hypothetical protein H310_11621 [Aphanomyces invadans]ETV94981.1 hypothetical protein H310_11621 [Aphanomyces invadans]|eukprot:XP_008876572.1 hypothetical protein H310_11621 [Aphanomyces invadans]